MERLQAGDKPGDGKTMTTRELKKQIEQLKKDKALLVGELYKTQSLLRQQVEIDKQNMDYLTEEIKQYTTQIQKDKDLISQYQGIYQSRLLQIQQLQKQSGQNMLSAENL